MSSDYTLLRNMTASASNQMLSIKKMLMSFIKSLTPILLLHFFSALNTPGYIKLYSCFYDVIWWCIWITCLTIYISEYVYFLCMWVNKSVLTNQETLLVSSLLVWHLYWFLQEMERKHTKMFSCVTRRHKTLNRNHRSASSLYFYYYVLLLLIRDDCN